MLFHTQEQEDVLVAEETTTGTTAFIIVYNDDFNTFDWVVKCFTEILGHTEQQAEQLSIFVHFKGKATVKTGAINVLQPMKEALTDRGLSAVIEEEKIEF
jgi:ATP-dependent Clp protease adaptor protein ClpS